MSNRALSLPQVRYSTTNLGGGVTATGVAYPGGLDQTTPSLRLQPGAVRDGVNFEVSQAGGYSRVAGYERTDGRAAPSAAIFSIAQLVALTNSPALGDVVTQATSGAVGTVIGVVTTPAPYLVLTMVTGSFDNFNVLTTPGPVTIGTPTQRTVFTSPETDAQYTNDAASAYRALIGPVPGSGPLLGVVHMAYEDTDTDAVYAFRANIGGTGTALYQQSPAGWVLVPFFNLLQFTAGSVQPQDGDTLTQGGVTAIIKRVMWQSGAFAPGPGNTGAGAFVVTNPVGGDFLAAGATTSSGGVITLSGAQTPITLQPGGNYSFVKCNFSGQAATRRIYGCDGVNPPFEFDGETYAPIATGLAPNRPDVIAFHKNYLMIAQASSLLYCGAGTPFKWTAVDGGGEIATGDHVHALLTLPGSQTAATLGVYMHNNVAFLYGTGPGDFNFVAFNAGMGAVRNSVQNLADTFFLDTLGVVTLKTTLNWGNFLPTSLTKNIQPFIAQQRGKTTASCIYREKSSYRLFFNDGYGLWITMVNQQYLGALPVLFPSPVSCCDESVTTRNEEVIYFGSSDSLGFVYQMERGTSFDGAPISAYITLAWDVMKSPRILKRFRAGSVEIQGDGYSEFQFGYKFGYDSPLIGQPAPILVPSAFMAAPAWDAFTWDAFTWDGAILAPSDVDMTGTAESVQVTISSGTAYVSPFTVNSLVFQYSQRRGMRV